MVIGIVFIVIGIILIAIAIFQYKSVRQLLQIGVTTTAKIIAIKESISTSTDMDGFTTTTKMYSPEFEFTDTKGNKIRHVSNISTQNKNTWEVGQEIEVVYDPKNPEKVKIKKASQLYLVPGVIAFIGIIFLFIGIIGVL